MLLEFYGHFDAQTGYGRAARDLANALHRHSGWKLNCHHLGPNGITPGLSNATGTDSPDVVLVHALPGNCGRVLEAEGYFDGNMAKGPPLVAYTTWEATRFFHKWMLPRDAGGWDGLRFDALWMPWQKPLDEMRDRVGAELGAAKECAGYGIKTAWIPHTYDPTRWSARTEDRDRQRPLKTIGPADALRFYWMGAPSARKNPFGVIRAFVAAFAGGDEKVALILHGPISPSDWAHLMAMTGADPRWLVEHVFLSNRGLDEAAIPEFHLEHDVFVTASRGEAWNLPAFEAALTGNWVIAPMGQGSDAFLNSDSSSRVTPLGIEPAWQDALVTDLSDEGGGKRAQVKVTGLQGLDPTIHCWDVPHIGAIAEKMHSCYHASRVRPTRPQDYSVYSYPEIAKTVVKALEDVLNRKG